MRFVPRSRHMGKKHMGRQENLKQIVLPTTVHLILIGQRIKITTSKYMNDEIIFIAQWHDLFPTKSVLVSRAFYLCSNSGTDITPPLYSFGSVLYFKRRLVLDRGSVSDRTPATSKLQEVALIRQMYEMCTVTVRQSDYNTQNVLTFVYLVLNSYIHIVIWIHMFEFFTNSSELLNICRINNFYCDIFIAQYTHRWNSVATILGFNTWRLIQKMIVFLKNDILVISVKGNVFCS